MEIPAPIVAFLKAIDDRDGARPDFSISIDGWHVAVAGSRASVSTPWIPVAAPPARDGFSGIQSPERHLCGANCMALGCAISGIPAPAAMVNSPAFKARVEMDRARFSDVASLSMPIPDFKEETLEGEPAAGDAPLTDAARAEFAAVTSANAPTE